MGLVEDCVQFFTVISEVVDCHGQDGRSPYFGAVVGRVANRIARGEFAIDGRQYKLAMNNGPNALHGGKRGFDKVIWDGDRIPHPDGDAVRLTYTSRDGEEVTPPSSTPSGLLQAVVSVTQEGT